MKNTLKTIGIGLFCLMMVFGFTAYLPKANALEKGAGLIISPPVDEKTVTPNQTLSGRVKITNPTENSLDIDVTVSDFTSKDEDGGQSFIDSAKNNSKFALGKWVTIDPKIKNLKSLETRERRTLRRLFLLSVSCQSIRSNRLKQRRTCPKDRIASTRHRSRRHQKRW